MPLRGPLAYPFGKPNSRFEINTPALVLDLDAFERNIACMAKTMKAFGRNLRPHAKSHKCSRIGKMQIDAGALGVCCATLDEAEVMVAAGLPGNSDHFADHGSLKAPAADGGARRGSGYADRRRQF